MKEKKWKPKIASHEFGNFGGLMITAVARTRIDGSWRAYIGVTTGDYPEIESKRILSHGAKLAADTARTIFKKFDKLPYAE